MTIRIAVFPGVALIVQLFAPLTTFGQSRDAPPASILVGAHYTTLGTPAFELGFSRDRVVDRTKHTTGAYIAKSMTHSLSVEASYPGSELRLMPKYGLWFRSSQYNGHFSSKKFHKVDLIVFGVNLLGYTDLSKWGYGIRPEIGLTWPRLSAGKRKRFNKHRFKLVYGYQYFLESSAIAPAPHQISLEYFREGNAYR